MAREAVRPWHLHPCTIIPIFALTILIANVAFADPAPALTKPQTLYVPAGEPATWLKGFEPVRAGDLRQLFGATEDRKADSGQAYIEQAIYRAAVRDGRLIDGQASFLIRRSGQVPALVPLGKPNLDLTNLRWVTATNSQEKKQNRESALAGSDPAGRRVVVVESGQSELDCDWSVPGQQLLDSTEYVLQLPPALVSQIELRVPDGFTIDCRDGLMTKAASAADRAGAIWQIDLGGHSECRLRIGRKDIAAPRAVVFLDQETAYFVSVQKLQIRATLQFDVLTAPINTFTLAMPSQVRVDSITYGDEVPLSFKVRPDKGVQFVDVELPQPAYGKARAVLIEASMPTQTRRLWNLPRIDVQNAVRRDGQVQVTVASPLKLLRFGRETSRALVEAPSYPGDAEETFVLRDAFDNAGISIEVGEPTPSLSARTFGLLNLRQDSCSFVEDIVCSAKGGAIFSIDCELSDAWEVTKVQPVGEASRVVRWVSVAAPRHRRRIKIDFYRAIVDGETRLRVEARRTAPKTGETIDLPIVKFPSFSSVESQFVVTHAPALDLGFEPASDFVPVEEADIPLRFKPMLAEARAGTDQPIVANRRMQTGRKATITFRRSHEGFRARVRSTVDVETSTMTERLALTVTPQAGPLDRVLVYLTTEGPPFTWVSGTGPPRGLDASRIASNRHSEWNLPLGGELWEVRLPEPAQGEVRLEGARKTSSLGSGSIGLVFVPGASTFTGTVEVRLYDGRQFEIDAVGPKPVPLPEAHARRPAATENRVTRAWTYDRPTDSLVLKSAQSARLKNMAPVASLELHSYLYAGATGDDVHQATFGIAPLPTTQTFHFDLNPEARLSSVAVNGRIVRVQRRGEEVIVPSLPSDRWNVVDVHYRSSSTRHYFREKRRIVVPRAKAAITQFRWSFQLAPRMLPILAPSGMQLSNALPALSWSERLFGPLGRSPGNSGLWPSTALITDLGLSSAESLNPTTVRESGSPAPGWTVWHAMADELPPSVEIEVWHESEMRTLSWMMCFGTIAAVLAVRRLRIPHRRILVISVLAAVAAAALALPGLYALPVGACFSGMLLAMLLSREWLFKKSRKVRAPRDATRVGSTVSYDLRPVAFLLAAWVIGCTAACGQENRSELEERPRNARKTEARNPPSIANPANGKLLVVVPEPEKSGIASEDQIVYVSSSVLEMLRRRTGNHTDPGGYLFLSSGYEITVDDRSSPEIEARYRIALTTADTRSIRLPLSNVTLAGANACRLNGQTAPLNDIDGGFLLNLPASISGSQVHPPLSALRSGTTRRPVEASRPQGGGPANTDERTSHNAASEPGRRERCPVLEISLKFFPKKDAAGGAGVFEFRVPPVAAAGVRLVKTGFADGISIETESGKPIALEPGRLASVNLGGTNVLRLKLGNMSVTPPVPLEARAVQLVRLSPKLIEIDCRVDYGTVEGRATEVEWMIPVGASVRASGKNDRVALGPPTPDGAWVPLRFAISPEADGPLILAATVIVSVKGESSPLPVPLIQFSGPKSSGASVKVVSTQVGVTTVPGYRAAVRTNERNLWRTAAADPAFRQAWQGVGRKEPDLIYDCRGLADLSVDLTPLVPTHKVLMSHEARISLDALQWKTTAEIRTENAPAFVHVLHVDPRLKIDSISIREDDVERLVRYSRSGDEVTLFLRDRAAATQDLLLTASMPLEVGRDTRLPVVELVGAAAADARILFEADPQVDVNLVRGSDGSVVPLPSKFILTDGDAVPLLRVARRREGAHVASATVVRPTKRNTVEVSTYVRVTGTRQLVEPIELTIPREVAARSTVVTDFAKQIRPHQDGTVGIIVPPASGPNPLFLEIHWTDTPRGSDWSVPVPLVTNAVSSEAWLVLSVPFAWQPAKNATSTSSLHENAEPDWLVRWVPATEHKQVWKSVESGVVQWKLTRPMPTPESRRPVETYTHLAFENGKLPFGSSFFLVEQVREPALIIRWPQGFALRSAFVDGRTVQPISSEGKIAVPLDPDGRSHRVALQWAGSTESQLSLASRIVEELPLPDDTNESSVLLSMTVPSGFQLLQPNSFRSLAPEIFAKERDAIVDVPQPTPNESAVATMAIRTFNFEFERGLQGRITVDSASASVQCWVYRDSLLTALTAIGAFVMVAVVLVALTARPITNWGLAHQPIVLAGLGTIWTICLTPAALGILLVVAALVWAQVRRRAGQSRFEASLPSTLHVQP